jgi:hypothetical protein
MRWAKKLKTSVIAFDIAQFFPSINHQYLLVILKKQGFHPKIAKFFESYLVERYMSYTWNNFTSDPRHADVQVGQGSAVSSVLSVLAIAPVMKLYWVKEVGLGSNLISYVDDGDIIVQSPSIELNCTLLKSGYGFIFDLFMRAALALEHNKTKLFYFTRA